MTTEKKLPVDEKKDEMVSPFWYGVVRKMEITGMIQEVCRHTNEKGSWTVKDYVKR